MKKILICGYGNIGIHIRTEFAYIEPEIEIYDKYKEDYCCPEKLETFYDYAIVCVPTEAKEDGSSNTSEVFEIVQKLKADTILIKSTIPVGTCEKIGMKNVVFSPEYYGTTQHSLKSPNFIILGGEKGYCCKIVQLYQRVKNGTIHYLFTDWKTAELVKYMENCWIATKVTFCNEFAKIAENFGVEYEELRECFIADERVSPYHTYVYREKPYYDSHCLNKDIPALLAMCRESKVEVPLMEQVYCSNVVMKKRKS